MKLHTLKPAPGSVKTRKRLGRGEGSGLGGTSTRGHKGAKSRSGYSKKVGFEGGQMPLQRRIPRFGFSNPFKIYYKPINLNTLQTLAENTGITQIDINVLVSKGLASKKDKIKILGKGTLTKAVEVKANAFSKTAQEAIEKVGGKVVIV
ncbi:MAG: 50S ribosomal protein L15 [Microscillaceae bacterium]|nr:50S ribosomal protein L15 [Microscillaceae bacterium]MDW8461820.1 50S ribosomal protein L15 [Cytophagales bacterium]